MYGEILRILAKTHCIDMATGVREKSDRNHMKTQLRLHKGNVLLWVAAYVPTARTLLGWAARAIVKQKCYLEVSGGAWCLFRDEKGNCSCPDGCEHTRP